MARPAPGKARGGEKVTDRALIKAYESKFGHEPRTEMSADYTL